MQIVFNTRHHESARHTGVVDIGIDVIEGIEINVLNGEDVVGRRLDSDVVLLTDHAFEVVQPVCVGRGGFGGVVGTAEDAIGTSAVQRHFNPCHTCFGAVLQAVRVAIHPDLVANDGGLQAFDGDRGRRGCHAAVDIDDLIIKGVGAHIAGIGLIGE